MCWVSFRVINSKQATARNLIRHTTSLSVNPGTNRGTGTHLMRPAYLAAWWLIHGVTTPPRHTGNMSLVYRFRYMGGRIQHWIVKEQTPCVNAIDA